MNTLGFIASDDRFLSRTEIKRRHPEVDVSAWSASEHVMLTRDKFNVGGELLEAGFADEEVVGASGSGVVIVFKSSVMDAKNYDASQTYPRISDCSFSDVCEVVLVSRVEDIAIAQSLLVSNNLGNIPVVLKSEWSR
jgi:hypothetical protein